MVSVCSKGGVLVCRATLVVLGIMVLGIGYHAHYSSHWVTKKLFGDCTLDQVKRAMSQKGHNCPNAEDERYFLAFITITFIFTLPLLVMSGFIDLRTSYWKWIDLTLNGLCAGLQMSAGDTIIHSANTLHKIIPLPHSESLRDEKLAAGAFAVIQSFLYTFLFFTIIYLHIYLGDYIEEEERQKRMQMKQGP